MLEMLLLQVIAAMSRLLVTLTTAESVAGNTGASNAELGSVAITVCSLL